MGRWWGTCSYFTDEDTGAQKKNKEIFTKLVYVIGAYQVVQ